MCQYLNFLCLVCSIWVDIEVSIPGHIALGISIHEVLSINFSWHLRLHHLVHNNHIVHILLLLFHLINNAAQACNDNCEHNESTGKDEEDTGINGVLVGLVITFGWGTDERLVNKLPGELFGWVESNELDTFHAVRV